MNESTIKEVEELNKSIDLMIESILHSEDDSSIPILYLRTLQQTIIVSDMYISYLKVMK